MCSPTAAITDYFKPGPLRPPVPQTVAARTTQGRPKKHTRLDPQDHEDAAKDNDEKCPRLDQQETIQDQNNGVFIVEISSFNPYGKRFIQYWSPNTLVLVIATYIQRTQLQTADVVSKCPKFFLLSKEGARKGLQLFFDGALIRNI